ncbi:MAG: hypothetical protein AAGE52_38725 [Myxococcota bacterium]
MTDQVQASGARAQGRTQKRVSGKLVGCGLPLVLLAIATTAVVTWFVRKDPHGPILDVVPIEDDLMVLRRGYAERGYVHLVRYDPDTREQVWSEALYGIDDEPALTVVDDRVLLRAREARGHAEVHVFSGAGEFQWRGARAQTEAPEGNPAFSRRPLWVDGETVFVAHVHDKAEVIVLSLADGSETARAEMPTGSGSRSAALYDGGLAIAGGDGMLRHVSATGEVKDLASSADGWCVVDGSLVAGTPHALVRLDAGEEPQVVRHQPAAVAACASSQVVLAGDAPQVLNAETGEVLGTLQGVALSQTANHVVDRYLPVHAGLIDLQSLSAVDLHGIDGRGMEIEMALHPQDFGSFAVARSGETLLQLDSEQRVRVPGLRGIRGDTQVLWAWNQDRVLELDPETLIPRHLDDRDQVEP